MTRLKRVVVAVAAVFALSIALSAPGIDGTAEVVAQPQDFCC